MKSDTAVTVHDGNTPQDMIRLAVDKGTDLSKLRELLEIQKDWEANEARKAFQKAVAAFKANPPRVTKDKQNAQYKSMYTTLGNLVNTVNPELSKHGLSTRWEIKQNGIIEVACILTHELGHSEKATAQAPADTSGAKNAIQQIKSTVTYLKAVTFESVTGLASSDANLDDDGAAAVTDFIDQKQLGALLDWIADTGTDMQKFLAYLKVEELEKLPKAKYEQALELLKAKKSKVSK